MRYQRPSRRRHFRPAAEALESRIALSAQAGVNLSANSVYGNDPIWTDLHNLATSWVPLTGSTLTLSPDGYPLVSASVTFALENYPSGNYEFSYTGTGTVTFGGVGQLTGPATVSGGVTTGTVAVNLSTSPSDWLTMQVTGVNSSNPMDNFHLMMPGYGNGTTPEPMFTPAFLQALEPFSDIRFMGWEGINNSTLSNWANRVKPTSFTTDGTGGVPIEDMIELCNVAQKDMWINVPTLATPQFIQSLSQLIYADLDPNLNVYVEFSNETWNGVYSAFSQLYAAAKANPLVTQSSNEPMMVAQQTAYDEVLTAQTFDQTFGAESSRVRPVLAAQASNTQIGSWELQFIQQNYGNPRQYIYAYGVGEYFNITSTQNVAGLTLNQLFADIAQDMTTSFVPHLQSSATLASNYGLPMVAYEGGNGLIPGANDLNFAVMSAAQDNPEMYQAYVTMMNDWVQVGGGVFDQNTLDGFSGQWGFWGMLPNVLATGSQEYDAMLSELETPGDANLDGTVDYADFQALAANYGGTSAYWEQGDFNDDGTVNWQDLNILRQNLDPAGFTLSQFAQQALFGQLGTVIPGQALEYDGYGVTYASSLPFASSSGTVERNENSQGAAIVLGGATYAEGLGALANSSVSLTLNGQYSQFESTIGVDGNSNSGSSVIFDVYGNGQLLYQSPTLTYASGVIPIVVNVAGVKTLTLTMSAGPGSSQSADHAVWADARLMSTANFGSTQPYALTWQLSQNGTVLSTQTADSFDFGALGGTYTLTLTVADGQGDTATASTVVTVASPIASASQALVDSHTEGSWIGTYGTQGYDVIGGPSSLPNYVTITPSGQSTYTWAASTSNPRALQVSPGTFGAAGCWYSSTSFTVDVNLIDGQSHELTMYALDYDNTGRQEEIQIINAATGAVLNSRVISSFAIGIELQWVVTGNVEIEVTKIAGPNAVLSGLFLDPTAVTSPNKLDGTTEGNWIGAYGTQGYDIIYGPVSLPAYASITASGAATQVWSLSTKATQALEEVGSTRRIASFWYSATSFTIAVNLTDGQLHNLAVYALDYDDYGRSETIQLLSAATGQVLDTESIDSFTEGVYVQWTISGSVVIKVTNTGPEDAVLSGIFLDPVPVLTASATFTENDVTTQGNWIGSYGSAGYDVIGNASSIPASVIVVPSPVSTDIWSSSTTAKQALQDAKGTGRIAACWYSSTSFTVEVDVTNGDSYNLELYVLDYDKERRTELIQFTNAVTGAWLGAESVSNFSGGVYVNWTISGNVLITFINTGPGNAVLSGLFLDQLSVATSSATASFVGEDTTTKGSWIGTYGTQGYDVIGNSTSLPSYATITPTSASTATWAGSTTDPRALQDAVGTSRIAACWYSSKSFTVDVDLTDGQVHDLELYFLDWDSTSRGELVTISNAVTGAVLTTQTVSSFHSGVYLIWEVSGNVLITFTKVSGANAVLSGLFLDPLSVSTGETVARPATGQGIGASPTPGTIVLGALDLSGSDNQAIVTKSSATSSALAPTSTGPLEVSQTNRIRVTQDSADKRSNWGRNPRLQWRSH
jgi:hypothetical protein